MNEETTGVAIEEFLGLKLKMFYLVDDNSEPKKAKNMNRNIVATITHNVYKEALLSNRCTKHSIIELKVRIIE